MRPPVSRRTAAIVLGAACLAGTRITTLDARQAPPQGQPAPQGQQPQGQQPPGQQPPARQPQGQRPPQPAPDHPPGILLPSEPAVPLLSAGVPAARSMQPGRAFERPYRGVFGGSAVGPGRPGLFLRLGAYGAYDDNVFAAQGGDRPGTQASGYYTGGSGALDYTRVGERFLLTAGGNGELRYYERFADTTSSMAAHAATTFQLGRKNTMTARQTLSRAELYRLGGLPGLDAAGEVPAADAEFSISQRSRIASDSFVGYARELTRVSRVTAEYSYRRAETSGLPIDDGVPTLGAFDLRVHGAGAGYERQIGRYTQLNLGYRRRSAWYETDGLRRHVLINDLNIGGGYVRPLSFSRRTTIRLSGGTGMISRAAAIGAPPVDYYRLTGEAGLEHEIGRTWRIIGSYTRGMQFIEGFADPFFLNSARLSTTGLLRPRVEFSAGLVYTDGRLALSARQNPYSSIAGTVRVGYSLSTHFELAADYAYRQYQFDTAAGLPGAVPQDLGRNSVTLRLNYWLPILTTR